MAAPLVILQQMTNTPPPLTRGDKAFAFVKKTGLSLLPQLGFGIIFAIILHYVEGPVLKFLASPVVFLWFRVTIAGIVVLALGYVAHWFKRKNQLWYGRVEVIFGLGSALSIAYAAKSGFELSDHWATLAGCIYVVARGQNNQTEAATKATYGLVADIQKLEAKVNETSDELGSKVIALRNESVVAINGIWKDVGKRLGLVEMGWSETAAKLKDQPVNAGRAAKYIAQLSHLCLQAHRGVTELRRLQIMYPANKFTQRPLFRKEKPMVDQQMDAGAQALRDWQEALREHAEDCSSFEAGWAAVLFTLQTQGLKTILLKFESNLDGQGALGLLELHSDQLYQMLENYIRTLQ
jgi:hypothetical protein